jgi:peptidoglycan-N-acetylglucosamine deacetylase
MESRPKQIFQSESGKRWKAFKIIVRSLLIFLILIFILFAIDLISRGYTPLPKLRGENEIYKKVLDPEHITTFTSKTNKRFKSTKQELKKLVDPEKSKKNKTTNPLTDEKIRAGFYVNWDAQSFFSLKDNINNLNVIFPEWMFLQDNADSVALNIDMRTLKLMQTHNVKIIPMLSNFYNNKWNRNNVRRIISTESKRKKLITNLLDILKKYDFDGINIDFENIENEDKDNLILFIRELHNKLHFQNYVLTQDVQIYDINFDVRSLKNYTDYLVLMAYDMHYSESEPGPVADINWVTNSLNEVLNLVEPNKIILGIPAYGYDWPKDDEGLDITYQEAIVTVKESEAKVQFDVNSNNLSYDYYDDNDKIHTVWFTDAATDFNLMRTADDLGISGVAIWRLGSEDPRIWKYFSKSLSQADLENNNFDISLLETVSHYTDIDYVGEGEILDIVSTPKKGKIKIQYDNKENLVLDENYDSLPSGFVVKKYGVAKGKEVIFTFDDGPDNRYTPEILDILKKENIKAAFFVLGINAENNLSLIKRIYDEGHEIGNHSFFHPNLAVISEQRTILELSTTRKLIESITGHSTILFRPPYDADTEPEQMQEMLPIEKAREENYLTIGASIDPQDWQPNISADTILQRIIEQQNYGSIILLHDAGGDRSQTVKALPRIIKYFKDHGYNFGTVAGLLNEKRNDVMPLITDKNEIYLSQLNWSVAVLINWIDRIIFAFFFLGIILTLARLLLVGVLAYIHKVKNKNRCKSELDIYPPVSIIVPAYNEEIHIVRNIENLLKQKYPDFEIVFVDDGSKDGTYQEVKKYFSNNNCVRIFSKPNGGKASALNCGINKARGEIVVCIDADTQLKPDAVGKLVDCFINENIAAVAGNVKVGNEVNLLSKWQSIEYITSQNFDRRAFELLNSITVVPGAIGAFRKKILLELGGFSEDTLAEDCELTIKLLRNGYTVSYNEKALAFTEVPETVKMFLKQRFRWSFGILQSLWKNRDAIFNHKFKNLGLIALPNVLIFQFLLPLFSPLAELMMVLAIIGGYWQQLIFYYIIFLILDLLSAFIAFLFEKEDIKKIWLIIPQRIIYRQLMYWILFKSFIAAIRGTLIGWGVLKRTGKVNLNYSS